MKNKILKAIKNIICSVLFLSILGGVLCGFSYLLRYDEEEKSTTLVRGFYALEEDSLDVVFIGGSTFLRSISPPMIYDEYEITSYNFCTVNFMFDSAITMMEEVRKTQNPDLFVIDLRRYYKEIIRAKSTQPLPQRKKEAYVSYLVNNMPLSLNRARLIHEYYGEKLGLNELEWQFDYLRTHNNWKELSFSDIKDFVKNIMNYKELNTVKYGGVMTSDNLKHLKTVDLSQYDMTVEPSAEELELLDNVIAYAKKNNLNVLFMTPPYAAPEEFYAYEKFLSEYIESQGFHFLNGTEYVSEMGIDYYTDFYDKNHLNALGSVKFTPFLADYITENYEIEKTALSAEQKSEWEESYSEWFNTVAKPYSENILKKCE
ncbi:MAG: hypothetical protein ACI4RU_05060 [Acutalibacteraceae bacterium]